MNADAMTDRALNADVLNADAVAPGTVTARTTVAGAVAAGVETFGTVPPRTVEVDLGERSYAVRIGPGVRNRLAEEVRRLGARRAAVVSARPREWTPDPGVPSLVLRSTTGTLRYVDAYHEMRKLREAELLPEQAL